MKTKAELLRQEQEKIKKLTALIKQGKALKKRLELEEGDLSRAITSQAIALSISRDVASILKYQAKQERRFMFKQQYQGESQK